MLHNLPVRFRNQYMVSKEENGQSEVAIPIWCYIQVSARFDWRKLQNFAFGIWVVSRWKL